VPTPNARSIADVCAQLGVEPTQTVKTLVFVGTAGPVLALVRGDQQVHEKKLARVLQSEVRAAHPDEVREALGAPVGSVGPVGAKLPIVADESLREGVYVCGANREGFHWTGVRPGQDFTPARYADIHVAQPGEGCPRCGQPLRVERVIEVGNIFKLGTKYSVPLGAVYLDERGQERPIVMGSYGIGPARIAAAAVEQRHDPDGIVWPWSIAPGHVHVLPVNVKDAAVRDTAERLARELGAEFEVLLDDRDERPGVKFKDADLLGLPIRVTVGALLGKEGRVEVRTRRARQDAKVAPDAVVPAVKELARQLAEKP